MSNWSDYKEMARSRGALAFELFVVITTRNNGGDVDGAKGDHLAYLAKQEAAGKLAFAGPLSDLTGEVNPGDGMIIYRAGSFEEAQDLAANDPMHTTGARSFTLRRWLVNEGRVSLSVGLSSGTVALS